jgi:5-methylcytosine-specific restriction enzyme A
MSHNRTRPDAGWSSGKRTSCRYCGGPLPKGRRTFCSGARNDVRFRWGQGDQNELVMVAPGHGCVHEWLVRSSAAYARQCVELRDQGRCGSCGVVTRTWQADHIVPVCEGGGECGLDGLRTLCTACHARETAALARRRAERRRAERRRTAAKQQDEDEWGWADRLPQTGLR